MTDKTPCRTPAEGRDGVTNIPTWKFDLCRRAILHAIGRAGEEGLTFAALPAAVKARLSTYDLERLGSLGWHVTTVKLELEASGEIERMSSPGIQRLRLCR